MPHVFLQRIGLFGSCESWGEAGRKRKKEEPKISKRVWGRRHRLSLRWVKTCSRLLAFSVCSGLRSLHW